MSGYSQGRDVEYAVIHALTEVGYDCTRAASSKGAADVIAIGDGEVLLVNVKRTQYPGPTERRRLVAVADRLGLVGVPLVAIGPAPRLSWWMLTGPGPRDRRVWGPELVDGIG